jgi:diamine N-acetyltransferase
MAVQIRQATIADYAQIAFVASESQDIHQQAHPDIFQPHTPGFSEDYLTAQLENPQATILVAEQDAQFIIGYAFLQIHQLAYLDIFLPQLIAQLTDIAVTASHRSQGIGQKLFDASRQWGRSQQADRLELTVWEFNGKARAFYERNGMQTLTRTMSLLLR